MFRKSFFFFSPDDGAGSGSVPPEGQSAGDKPIFTQAQLDGVVKERLAKAQANASGAKARVLSELGLDENGVADYKKYLADKEAADTKRKEEQGQFQAIIKENQEKHAKELKKIESEREDVRNKYQSTVIKNTILALASEMELHAPEDVFQLSKSHFKVNSDESIAVVGDAGEPLFDETGKPYTVKTFLAAWLENKPYFVKSKGGGSGTGGGKAIRGQHFKRSQLTDSRFYEANRDAIKAAAAAGLITND
jgi:hypothetical protein